MIFGILFGNGVSPSPRNFSETVYIYVSVPKTYITNFSEGADAAPPKN